VNYLTALNRKISSYPSIIPREFNLLRVLEHLPTVMPKAKIVGGKAIASKSQEVSRRTVKTGIDTVSIVDRNTFTGDIEDPGKDSPFDVAITGEELVKQATEHNPDVRAWTINSLALVTKPLVSHENFDNIESIVRTLNAHGTLGRNAGFYGVMNTYYESRAILQQMGLWNKKFMPAYRPRSVMKTHKIMGRNSEGNNIGYEELFFETKSDQEQSVAQKFFTETTKRGSRLLDVGIPEPIITRTNGELLLEKTGATVFVLLKNSRRIAAVLGPDIPIYTYENETHL